MPSWRHRNRARTRSTTLVQAWRRERADLDLAPVEVFSRISRLARLLDLARREAFTAQAIEPWEFDVLAALRRAGKPYRLSPGQLLRETMVTSGTMTNRIDRLGDRGLVDRSPDPHDRRGVLVGLTADRQASGRRRVRDPARQRARPAGRAVRRRARASSPTCSSG